MSGNSLKWWLTAIQAFPIHLTWQEDQKVISLIHTGLPWGLGIIGVPGGPATYHKSNIIII